MKLKVNTWQRQMLGMLCGEMKGNVSTIRQAMKLLDVLELTEEEKKKINFRTFPEGQVWDDADLAYELDIEKEGIELLCNLYSSFDQWPANQAQLVLDLGEQLGVEDS